MKKKATPMHPLIKIKALNLEKKATISRTI